MRAQQRRILDRPAFLLALTAFLTALLLQSGELGSIDTIIRLQTTHSYWTSKPSVPDNSPLESHGAVAVGKNGRMYAAYGMGQSLLMLPSDIAGTLLEHLFRPGLRSIVVSYSTDILVCVVTVLVCFRWLRLLEFTPSQGIAGAFALLFGTTFLHYTQNMMENNLMFLLTLTGLCFQYEWLRTGRTRSLVIGCLALGANLLIRLTTAMDVTAAGLFVLLVLLWKQGVHGREALALTRIWRYVRVAGPCYAAFLVIDRAYQYHRFGSIFSTYLSVLAEQQKRADASLSPDYPWSTPLHVGLLGPLISPEKSIFLFDPLILLTIFLCLLLWKRLHPEIEALLVTGFSLLAMYILFYAKYYAWSGDFAWGDRYITTPVQLLAMISIPLLLRHRPDLGKIVPRLGMAVAFVSVVIQLASVVFWHPLEIDQMETLGHPTFVVGLRFENIAAVALGKVNQWSLSNQATWEKDGIHSDTPYFLPFLCRKDGRVSNRTADGLIAAWSVGLAVLIVLLWLIQRKARRGDFAVAVFSQGP
jgi:hypothetical protein